MITVKSNMDIMGRACSLSVNGHAGYAEFGQDILCASASILVYTLAQYITMAEEREELSESPVIDLESGNAHITCKAASKDAFDRLAQAFYMCQIGYALLAEEYPQYIKIQDDDAFFGFT